MPTPTKTTRLVREAASDHLADGEAIDVGLRVMLKNLAFDSGVAGARAVSGALGSFAANKARTRIDEERAKAEATGLPMAPAMGYGLTDRRIMVWSLDALTNRPDTVIGDISLSEIESVAFKKGFLFGKLTLRLRDGRELVLDVARVEKGQPFADALENRLGARVGSP